MKRLIPLFLTLTLALSLAVPTLAAGATPTFSDVPETFWAYSQIEQAYADGVVTGTYYNEQTGERQFSPGATLTISQFVVILTRAFYSSEVDASTATGTWYAKNDAVAKAHNLYNKMDTVVMDSACSRAQMAQLMYNVMLDKGADLPSVTELQATKAKIPDINKNSFVYQDAIATCYYLGLLVGTDNAGNVSGSHILNRAQSSVVYIRMRDAIASLVDPDNPDGPDPDGGWDDVTLANGKPVTEENVLEILDELKLEYPDKSTYDPDTPYYSPGLKMSGIECAKIAFMFSDAIWGKSAPVRTHTDYDNIRPGDILDFSNETHWSLAIGTPYPDPYGEGLCVQTVDGGSAGIVTWGDPAHPENCNVFIYPEENNYVVYTRYPE